MVASFVSQITEARDALAKNSDGWKKLNRVVGFLGTEGDENGVTIAGDKLAGDRLSVAAANNTILLDTAKILDVRSNNLMAANPGKSEDFLQVVRGAQATAHEARHLLDRRDFGWPQTAVQSMRAEMNSYSTSQAVYKGSGGVEGGLSTPQAISEAARQSTAAWCQDATAQGFAQSQTGCAR